MKEITMSATLQIQASHGVRVVTGLTNLNLAKRLAGMRDFVAATSAHEMIEAVTLLAVCAAATGLLAGAFGVHIGAH
jgi:hypothetical protein